MTFIIMMSMQLRAQTIAFQTVSISEAKAIAKKESKPLFIDFYATWCAPCKQMEHEVFADATVAELMNEHFVSIRVDAEKQDLAQVKLLKVTAYPTLIFFGEDGKIAQRQEGALNANDFLERAMGVSRASEYEKAYTKRPQVAEHVYHYAASLRWSNPKRAQSLVKKYMGQVKDTEYEEEYNWKIIQHFIEASDKFLFGKVIRHPVLPVRYPEEFRTYLLQSVNNLVDVAIEQKRPAQLLASTGYVQDYPSYFSKPDSLQLTMNLRYAQALQSEQFAPLMRKYLNTYLSHDQNARLTIAFNLVQNYFGKDILALTDEVAETSIRNKPTAKAYLIKALANERRNDFRAAYGNILLAYTYADGEIGTEQLDEYQKIMSDKLTYEFNAGVNLNRKGSANNDGRFTLGAGTKRLMFGFPVPESTSHFIVNVNGKLASNAPHFQNGNMAYLTGTMKYDGEAATPRVTVQYEFENTKITQYLTPVDKEGNEVSSGLAQYYKLSYEFENLKPMLQHVGLAMLFDTMVDDNDYCHIMAGHRPINMETKFSGDAVPEALQFYRMPKDTSDFMGEAILRGLKSTPPDNLVVGRWQVLQNLTWKLTAVRVPYGDSAYMLQWENKPLSSNGKVEFITYYGLPKFKKPELQAIMKGETYLTKKLYIYFGPDSDELDLNAKMQLSALAEDKTLAIRGVMLNGYSDITGENDYNFDLSKRRIAAVDRVLESQGIACVPKPYGVDEAQRNEFDKAYGNVWDRRVDVIVYYRIKNKATP